jgi:hypothetical protein
MKKKVGIDNQVVRSILTDFFFTRVAFRVELEGSGATYFVSTLYDDAESFVLLTILMLSDIDRSVFENNMGSIIDDTEGSDVEDDEEEEEGNESKRSKYEENDLASRFSAAASKSFPAGSGGRKSGAGKRNKRSDLALQIRDPNIMAMGDDDDKENKRIEIQRMLGWEARYFAACLSFNNNENIANMC